MANLLTNVRCFSFFPASTSTFLIHSRNIELAIRLQIGLAQSQTRIYHNTRLLKLKMPSISFKPSSATNASASVLIRESLKDFSHQTTNKILALPLSTFETRSEQVTSLWTNSTTTLPRVFTSAECWDEEHLPSTTNLILSTLHLIEAAKKVSDRSFYVYRRSEPCPTVNPRLAIAQLVQPTESSPVVLIGLDVLPKGVFHMPVSLAEFVEGAEEANQQLLLTPKYAFTDLHVDTSDGVSSPIGQCRKLWMVFPPTEKNIGLMKKADGQRAKLVRIGKNLEGGLVFTTNSDEAIYLPAGCIHAVITLDGGFLVAIDFVTPLSSRPLAAVINAGLDDSGAGDTFREEISARFLSSVDYGLSYRYEDLAITSWITTLEKSRQYAKESPIWKKKANQIWNEFFEEKKKKGEKIICVCGEQGNAEFEGHIKGVHMWQVSKGKKRKFEEEPKSLVEEKKPARQSKRLKARK
ncbi:hypothetical protein VTL71DRAFT_10435 [Oculimacula yallundae]|uniref:JmjC domain-containing protein n=1 Tax=Oculimacula yallundae TaxID=86028 RepID=A0ABR4CVA3_9HELO